MDYTIYIGTYDGILYVLSLTDHAIRLVRKITCSGSIRALAEHQGVIHAAGYQGIIKVVDLAKKLDRGEILASKACINSIVICPETGVLVVAGEEGVLQFYKNLELFKTVPAHNKGINQISLQGQILVTASKDKKIKFWDSRAMSHIRTIKLSI